ncbi:MAG TPA: hypothetical protein VHD34_01155 [Xanthobacteraceae bacterium]|nr:hypothetical protein [Xanthobacteraceae bacterium]
MNQTNTYPNLHLAAARLLDAIEARPRGRAEFEAAKTNSLQSVREAFANEPARGAARDFLRLAARRGRALGASRKDDASRHAADFLDLPSLCSRSACQRAQGCRADARACLTQFGARVPESVRAAMLALCARMERGDSLELAVALLPFASKAALWAWWRTVKVKPVIGMCERSEPSKSAVADLLI